MKFYSDECRYCFVCDGLSVSYPKNIFTARQAYKDFSRYLRNWGKGLPYINLTFMEV